MRWRGVIAVEGKVTTDGRLIEPTAVTWGELPIPLMYGGVQGRDFDRPLVGSVETVERREVDGTVLILGEGEVFGQLPSLLDLSAFVDDVKVAGEGVDYPMAVTHGRLRSVIVGDPKVWDQCVLEVVPDGEG